MAGKKGIKMRRYTQQERGFLRSHVRGRSYAELAALFNSHFSPAITQAQVKSFCANNKLRNGRDTRLKPGHTTWNKGLQGVNGFSSTRFKKGNRPQTWRPVGSERINREGLIEVKVAEPRTWRPKQRVLWEAANGPLPSGHVVLFADRNTRNFTLENLVAVPRKELLMLNKFDLIKTDTELTKTGTAVAKLILATAERRRRAKRRQEARV